MNEKYILEKIGYYNNFKNNLWTAFIVLTGGLSGLFLGLIDIYRKFLFYSGLLFDTAIIIGIIVCLIKSRKYIKKLNEVK